MPTTVHIGASWGKVHIPLKNDHQPDESDHLTMNIFVTDEWDH